MSTTEKPFDVFISHSSADAQAASAIKQQLQGAGLRCWKAPDDIVPGESWPSAITRALSSCRSMVLVWSGNSMASSEVSKELTLAMRNGVPVVPFRIEDVKPTSEWTYHLANTHWMDAFPGDLRPFVAALGARIRSLLDGATSDAPATVADLVKKKGKFSLLKIAAIVIALSGGAFALWQAASQRSDADGLPAGPPQMTTEPQHNPPDEAAALRERVQLAEKEKAQALQLVAEKDAEAMRAAAQGAEQEKLDALARASVAEHEAEQLSASPAAAIPGIANDIPQPSAAGSSLASPAPLAGFSRVKIAEEFSDVVSRGDLLLESGGGKIINMPDGSRWVLGVGIASVNPQGGGAEIIRQRTVAEQRARKAIVSEFESSSVASTTTATSTTTIVLRDGTEAASSSDQVKEQIQSEVEGILKGLRRAGSWYSPDGQIFYLALCAKLR